MAVWITVGLKNQTRTGLAEMRKDISETADVSASLFETEGAKELETALHGVSTELQRMNSGMQQQQQATQAIRDQAAAQKEVQAVTQQSITINEAEKTSMADVAMTGLQAYLMYQKINAIKSIATSLWASHSVAIVRSGAALAGLTVATGGMIGVFMAASAVLGLVTGAFSSLKKSGSETADNLEESGDRVGTAWASLGDKVSMIFGDGDPFISMQTDVMEDIAAAIYTVRDALPDYTIGEALFGGEGTLSERAEKEFGKLQVGLQDLATKSLYFGGSMTHSVLNSLGGLSDKILGPEAAAMLETTRAVFTEATLQREQARTQGLQNEEFFKKLAEKQADTEIAAKTKAFRTITDLDRALADNKAAIKSAADGSEGSEKNLKTLRKERQEMEGKRQSILSEQIALTERLNSIERKGQTEFIKGEADELRSVRQVEQAQQSVLDLMKKLNSQGKLDKAALDEASQRYDAYAARKQTLLKDEADTLKAVAKINAELQKEKDDATTKAAQKAIQELKDAIREAKGVLNPEQSLTSELEGQFSGKEVADNLVRNRREEARAKRLEELRGEGKVGQNGKANGETSAERQRNQLDVNRELAEAGRNAERDARRQIQSGGKGKVKPLEEDEVIATRQRLLNERADKAVKDLRMSPQVRDAMREQQKQENEERARQRGLADKTNQMKGLLGPQPGQPGANPAQQAGGFNPAQQAGGTNPAEQAVTQGFGEFGNMARSQMQWGQQVTQMATAAQADAAASKQLFDQLNRQMAANGARMRATRGALRP